MQPLFSPKFDRVLIRRIEEPVKPGVVIPDKLKDKPVEGEVVAVGPGRWIEGGMFVDTETAVGDFVVFGKFAGTEIMIDGQEYVIVREEEILGTTKKAEPSLSLVQPYEYVEVEQSPQKVTTVGKAL